MTPDIIDVQDAFINGHSRPALSNMRSLIKARPYDAYIEAVFSAPEGSIWDRQTGWYLPDSGVQTVPEIGLLLSRRNVRRIHKHTKSIFRADEGLAKALRSDGIEELHLLGFDVNDCVLASAFDAFDNGFFTYVLEECCAASARPSLKRAALTVLRHLHLTNNSQLELVPSLRISGR